MTLVTGRVRTGDGVERAVMREAFKRSGLTLSEVAYRLDWTRGSPSTHRRWADTARLRRALGTQANINRGKVYPAREMMHYETAVVILRALNRDPVDFGL